MTNDEYKKLAGAKNIAQLVSLLDLGSRGALPKFSKDSFLRGRGLIRTTDSKEVILRLFGLEPSDFFHL